MHKDLPSTVQVFYCVNKSYLTSYYSRVFFSLLKSNRSPSKVVIVYKHIHYLQKCTMNEHSLKCFMSTPKWHYHVSTACGPQEFSQQNTVWCKHKSYRSFYSFIYRGMQLELSVLGTGNLTTERVCRMPGSTCHRTATPAKRQGREEWCCCP